MSPLATESPKELRQATLLFQFFVCRLNVALHAAEKLNDSVILVPDRQFIFSGRGFDRFACLDFGSNPVEELLIAVGVFLQVGGGDPRARARAAGVGGL